MEKIKKRYSLKWRFLLYLPVSLLLAVAGSFAIGYGTNELQNYYGQRFSPESGKFRADYELIIDEEGYLYHDLHLAPDINADTFVYWLGYWIVSYSQFVLMPLWILLCLGSASWLFYKREMEKPIRTLFEASEKIADNSLDFHIEKTNPNELGDLCDAFEKMRVSLQETNRENFRILEERKRLNAAFSHDMRTPVTVLKGYVELLQKYAPKGQISSEKLLEIMGMMEGQITRLESYTQKMGAVQKIEDRTPDARTVLVKELMAECASVADMLKKERQVAFTENIDADSVRVDKEMVMEVYENMLSNALRYARSCVSVSFALEKGMLSITVEDDGAGFSPEALQLAANPFYREEREENAEHFGLGLYISRILCEKCGGELVVENRVLDGVGKRAEEVAGVGTAGGRETDNSVADAQMAGKAITGARVTARFREAFV